MYRPEPGLGEVDPEPRQGRRIRHRVLATEAAEPAKAQPVGQSLLEIAVGQEVSLPVSRTGKAGCGAGAVRRPRRCCNSNAFSWTKGRWGDYALDVPPRFVG